MSATLNGAEPPPHAARPKTAVLMLTASKVRIFFISMTIEGWKLAKPA